MDTQSTSADTHGGCCKGSPLQSSRVVGALTLVLILLAAFLFASTIKSLKEYRYVGGGVSPSNVIQISGEGEAFVVPDTAQFTFSIIEEGDTVSVVTDAAEEKANAAITLLKEQGTAEKDIKTISYELRPKYEWKPVQCVHYPCDREQVQKGFILTQSVRVKVTDLDKAGEILGSVTESGVQSVTGLTFTVSDEDGVQAEARKLAIDDARSKAEKLAGDLGVTLVRIVGFSESGQFPSPMARSFEDSAMVSSGADVKAATPILQAGESRVVSNVHITYEIR